MVVVDQQLADQMWPHESALGHRLLLPRTVGNTTWVEVVGVVAHVQMDGLRRRGLPEIFMTYATRQYSDLNIVARGAHDPVTFAAVAAPLCIVALVASTLPAIRAVRVDPMLALRSE